MENAISPAVTDDDTVVYRLFDLARNGDTESREFIQLGHLVSDRLEKTYGSEILSLRNLAA
ncbi:MAG: hypothetical protein KA144_09410 [Xanthomonadaceae bacterium]|nr:hypothetical protein [Xanthomonadaceae bacterium]